MKKFIFFPKVIETSAKEANIWYKTKYRRG